MHKRIAEAALESLDKEKAAYFANIVERVAEDGRTGFYPNIVYVVLKETMWLLPVYLDKKEFIDLLFRFVVTNSRAIQRKLFSKDYIDDSSAIRPITDVFVNTVVDRTMELFQEGEIDSGEPKIQKFSWPYRAEDLIDPDDDEAEAVEKPPYSGPERRR